MNATKKKEKEMKHTAQIIPFPFIFFMCQNWYAFKLETLFLDEAKEFLFFLQLYNTLMCEANKCIVLYNSRRTKIFYFLFFFCYPRINSVIFRFQNTKTTAKGYYRFSEVDDVFAQLI